MITRITRGVLIPNSEGRVFEALREASQTNPRPPGLLGMSISRHVDGAATELVSVTIWEDIDAMAAVMGPAWHEPSWMPAFRDSIASSTIEILETVVSSYEQLRDVAASE